MSTGGSVLSTAFGDPLPRCAGEDQLLRSPHRHDVHRLVPHLTARRLQASDDRRHVGIVATMADGDVVVAGAHGVGGVELLPAHFATAPDFYPGMHGVGAFEPLLALRRDGAQETRDVAGRNADAAQAGDHHVREILADAALQPERIGCMGC